MVSKRTRLLQKIERELNKVRGQRQQVGQRIGELRSDITRLKPTVREKLPQRRFGASVPDVQRRQQEVLRRRGQATRGISERETEIERLGTVEAELARRQSELLESEREIESIPEIIKMRRRDIEAGILTKRELAVSIREIPPQQLGAIITRDEVPPTKVERVENIAKIVNRFVTEGLDAQVRADRINTERILRGRQEAFDTFNKDVDDFNRQFSGRELEQEEFASAGTRQKELESRAKFIESEEKGAQEFLAEIEARRKEKRFIIEPKRIGIALLTAVGTAPGGAVLLATGLATRPVSTVKETVAGFKEGILLRPIETVAEVLGATLVFETAFRGIKAPVRKVFKVPVRILKRTPKTLFKSVEAIKAVSPDLAKAQFRITGVTPARTAIIQTRFDILVEKTLGGLTAEQGSLSRLFRRRQRVIELAPEFRTEIISGEFLIRRGKIVSDAATLTVRERGRISVQRLRGEVEARRVTLSDITKFDPAFKKALQAIAERTAEIPVAEAAVPRVLGKLGKPAEVQVGRVITKDVLKTTRKGLKDLEFEIIPEGRTIRRARIAFTTKELKPKRLKVAENVEFFETITALEDVTFPRLRTRPEAIQTIRGITKFIDLPEEAGLKIVRLGGTPLKKLGLKQKLDTIAATQAVKAAAIPKAPRAITRARQLQKAEAAITKSPTVQRATQLSRTRFAAQTRLATPEKSLNLSKESARLTTRQIPKLSEKLITKQVTKQLPKLTTKLVSKQIPKLSTKLATKLVTKLVPKLTTKLVSKAVTKPVAKPKAIIPKTLLKPIILPRGEPLPKPRKKKKKEFEETFLLAPDISSRAVGLKVRIPKAQLGMIAKELKTGLGLAKIPIIK